MNILPDIINLQRNDNCQFGVSIDHVHNYSTKGNSFADELTFLKEFKLLSCNLISY